MDFDDETFKWECVLKCSKWLPFFVIILNYGAKRSIFKNSPFIESYSLNRIYRWSFWIKKGIGYKISFVVCLDPLEFYVTMIKSYMRDI